MPDPFDNPEDQSYWDNIDDNIEQWGKKDSPAQKIQDDIDKGTVKTPDNFWDDLISVSDLMKKPVEPMNWLIKDVIPMGSVTLIGGDSNVGKSWICLDLFIAANTNTKWLGRIDCKPANVLYFIYEDSERSVRRRLTMLLKGRDLKDNALDKATNSKMYFLPGSKVTITNAQVVRRIIDIAKELKSDIIIFDTLRKATPGAEENDSASMDQAAGNVNQIAKETGAAVILTHHSRKPHGNSKGPRIIRKEDLRGSTALVGAVDAIVCLSRIKEDVRSRTNVLQLFVDKQRDGIRGKMYGISQQFIQKGGPSELDTALEWGKDLGLEDPAYNRISLTYNKLKENEERLEGTFSLSVFSKMFSSRKNRNKIAQDAIDHSVECGFIKIVKGARAGEVKYELVDQYDLVMEEKRQEAEARIICVESIDETILEDEECNTE